MAAQNKCNTNLVMWNADSIMPKKNELHEFFREYDVDVALVSETHLDADCTFKMHSKSVYRNDRNRQGGGTAIIVKRGITHHVLDLPELKSLEATAVAIKTTNHGWLRLISVYKPPKTNLDTGDLDMLFGDTMPTIIAGDLNCKHQAWNSRVSNKDGRILHHHWRSKQHNIIGPDRPTHFPNTGSRGDVLDIILTQNVKTTVQLEVVSELNSDHNPVLITVGDNVIETLPSDKINTRHIDWDMFQDNLDGCIETGNPKINSIHQIEEHVRLLTQSIISAAKASLNQPSAKNCKSWVDLPPAILRAIAAKNKIRKMWQLTRIRALKTRLNKVEREVKKMISDHRNKEWERKLTSLNAKDKSLWQMTKSILRIPTKSPPLHGVNGMAYSNIDKANAMADTLATTFYPNDNPSCIDNIEAVGRSIRRLRGMSDTVPGDKRLCSPAEVLTIIYKLRNNKAPGCDNISNVLLKNLSRKAICFLTKIFNSMILHNYFPHAWKKSKIILFPKPGKDPIFPQNHRPISLLSSLSKVFEKILLSRVQDFMTSENIIINEQFGFRKDHSTNHQLLRLSEKIVDGFNSNSYTGVVFLDIATAFDKVWHNGLLHKLMALKFPTYIVKLIQSYLKDRFFEVHHANSTSSTRKIRAGVPQGSILGPTLFNIYINDIPRPEGVELALFADDTAVIAQSWHAEEASEALQSALDILEEWYTLWRIKINVTKSQATMFSRRRHKTLGIPGNISLFDETIVWKDKSKYLGVIMDQRLNWGSHIKETIVKTTSRLAMLRPLLNKKSKLSLYNKLTLYKTILLPMMTYGSNVWGNAAPTNIKKLQVQQNKILREITASPWYCRNKDIHADLRMRTITEFIKDTALKFYAGLQEIKNPLISSLGIHDYRDSDTASCHRYKHSSYVMQLC